MDYYKNLDLAPIKYFCEFDLIWKVEEWRGVLGYERLYQVSDLGRVKSLKFNKEKILRSAIMSCDYYTVSFSIKSKCKTFTIHNLVAIAFLNHKPCGYTLVVNHKNFIRSDNRKLNLEIITVRENTNKKHIKSASQYVGVGWHKIMKKWTATIVINKKNKYLGSFINEIDAHNAYQNKLAEINNLIKN